MKLLTKKEQEEILKRIAACQIIANEYISDVEAYDKMTENLVDIAISVGGCEGVEKVQNTVRKYNE